MIKFFRKIRYDLMAKNKTGKYFKYAIGEIVLVVIGILFALQINTWNENRKATNEEVKILYALQADFKITKERIQKTMVEQSRVLRYSEILINIHERQNRTEYEFFNTHLDSLDNLINYGSAWYRAEPVTGAYKSLISAGKIDLIQNESLRHLLAQFIADFESGFEDQESSMHLLNTINQEISGFTLKIGSNKFRKRFNITPRKKDSYDIAETFFTNDSFFGNLYTKLFIESNRLKRQELMLTHTNSILELINDEIK